MRKNKKAIEFNLNMLVAAVILLLILVVTIVIVSYQYSEIYEGSKEVLNKTRGDFESSDVPET